MYKVEVPTALDLQCERLFPSVKGTMAQIRVEINVDASPQEVRAVVLDFSRYAEWHTSFMNSLATIPPGLDPYRLTPGDRIRAGFSGNTVEPVILANNNETFRWKGSTLLGAFAGEHYFEFFENKGREHGAVEGEHSESKTKSCIFVHGENYDGWMTWLFGEGVFGFARSSVEAMYRVFAEDVKARVEAVKKSNQGE